MLKKISKVFIVTVLLIAAIFNSCIVYAALDVNLPSSDNAKITGFTVKRTMSVYYNCKQPVVGPKIESNQVVGYCYTYIGRYRANKKIDGKYYDALLIKSCMSPNTFYDKKGNTRYGFSQYLRYNMTLNNNCIYQANTPTNNTTGSKSYSIGITGGMKEASVSASINNNSKYCDITDLSNQNSNSFKVEYDYKTSVWDWKTSSERNKNVLFAQTWQMATCEWTTTSSSYNLYLGVYAKFGISQCKNGSGMYTSLYDYSSSQFEPYTCYFSN